jgi:fatty-acyl-CoA synthase
LSLDWLTWTPYSVVEARARLGGQDPAVIVVDSDECVTTVTYRELHEGIRRRAGQLWSAGVRAGSHVGIWSENSVAWLEVWLATSLIGAVTVALNSHLKAREAAYLLRRNDVTHLLAGAALTSAASELQGVSDLGALRVLAMGSRIGEFDSLDDMPASSFKPASTDGDRTGLIQFTSGSTGMPKGAQLREGSVVTVGASLASRWLLRTDDRMFGIFAFAHGAGTTFTAMSTFTTGAAIVLPLDGWRGGSALELIDTTGVTVLPVVDTIVNDLLAAEVRLHSLRLVVGTVDPPATEQLMQDLGVDVVSSYGLTETTAAVVAGDIREPPDQRPRNVGRPYTGIEVRIVGPHGDAVEASDVVGEIQVRGWAEMRGYYGVARDEQPFTADGWVTTGDLGSLDARGYLTFHGRSKDIVRSGGENVSTFEIERMLETHPTVLQAVVVPVLHARFGEAPYAYVRLRPDAASDEDQLIEFCRQRMARFKVPRHVELIDNFPLVAANKVARAELKRRAGERIRAAGLGEQAVRSSLEREI